MSEDLWTPDFKPGWPAVFPSGLITTRLMVTPRAHEKFDHDHDLADDVDFSIQGSSGPLAPKFALLAELTVSNEMGFAGVTVLMPLLQRDEPEELSVEDCDALLAQFGEWAAPVLYDHAATQLRAALAGVGLPLDVPYETPRPTLHFHADDELTQPEVADD